MEDVASGEARREDAVGQGGLHPAVEGPSQGTGTVFGVGSMVDVKVAGLAGEAQVESQAQGPCPELLEEQAEGSESLDYPFGVAVFEVRDFGAGEGTIYPQAAIRVDLDDETVMVEQYYGEPGSLIDVKKVR